MAVGRRHWPTALVCDPGATIDRLGWKADGLLVDDSDQLQPFVIRLWLAVHRRCASRKLNPFLFALNPHMSFRVDIDAVVEGATSKRRKSHVLIILCEDA